MGILTESFIGLVKIGPAGRLYHWAAEETEDKLTDFMPTPSELVVFGAVGITAVVGAFAAKSAGDKLGDRIAEEIFRELTE